MKHTIVPIILLTWLAALGCSAHVEGAAASSGTGAADAGGPKPFECGQHMTCDGATEYCHDQWWADGSRTQDCEPLPSACVKTPTCACVDSQPGVLGNSDMCPNYEKEQCPDGAVYICYSYL